MAVKETILIPQVVSAIVTRAIELASAELQANNGGVLVEPYFIHGTPRHIVGRLAQRSKDPVNKNKRFPLIALVHNYEERFNSSEYYNETDFTMWIMNLSKKDTPYNIRYEENFLKFLYPLWEALVKAIKKSGYAFIDISKGVEHTKIDRPNWGLFGRYGNTAYELGEMIDGIELKFSLRFNYTNCLRAQKENRIIN